MKELKAIYIGAFWPTTEKVEAQLVSGLKRYKNMTILLENNIPEGDIEKRLHIIERIIRPHPHVRVVSFNTRHAKSPEDWHVWYGYVSRITHQTDIFYTDAQNPDILKRALDCAQGLWSF